VKSDQRIDKETRLRTEDNEISIRVINLVIPFLGIIKSLLKG
jgi:hypothetical protein